MCRAYQINKQSASEAIVSDDSEQYRFSVNESELLARPKKSSELFFFVGNSNSLSLSMEAIKK